MLRAADLRRRIPQRHTLLLLGLILCVVLLNALWLASDTRPPHWDRARHLGNSLTLLDTFPGPDIVGWLLGYLYYPPFVYWVSDLFYAVLGRRDLWLGVLSQSVFLAALVFATYGIGRRLWGRPSGVLAAVCVVTTPMLVSGFKDYMLDAPLTALTAVALYLLLESEGFSRRRYAVLFGLACGFGELTKWSFVLVMALPTAFALFGVVRAPSRARLLNVVAGGAVAMLVGLPWYVRNFGALLRDTHRYDTVAAQIEGDPPVLSARSFLYYAWNLMTNQLYLIPTILLAIGIVLLFRRPGALRRNAYPLLLIIGSYVSMTALENKDPRFTMPMLPAIAVVATYWIDACTARVRRGAAAVTVMYGAIAFLGVSFGLGVLPREVFVTLPSSPFVSPLPSFTTGGDLITVNGIRLWAEQSFPLGPPSNERWHQEEIFARAARDGGHAVWSAGPGDDEIWFNTWAMAYFATRYHLAWVADPARADLAAIRAFAGSAVAPPSGFHEVAAYTLPDRSSLHLYERAENAIRAEPTVLSVDELSRVSARVGHAVFWAGPIPNTVLEVTQTANGWVYVRYLPNGTRPGATASLLTIATYPLVDAYRSTEGAARAPGAVPIPVANGVAFYSEARPTSVYLAQSSGDVQVEIFDPDALRAQDLVRAGNIVPIR